MSVRAGQAETARRVLLPAAVGDLAHELRGSLHVIRGHAELLRETVDGEDRESANYIFDACGRLAGLCEDVIEFLRLPSVAPGEMVALALADLGRSLARVAADRGTRVRVVEPADATTDVQVKSAVRRVVAHVVEHAVRMAESDVTVTTAINSSRAACTITVSPAPIGAGEGADGIVAVAGELLAARGAALTVSGRRIDLLFPVVG